jgi:stalled ribosome rescue protein Dom34
MKIDLKFAVSNIPILCISTYLPTKVENDRYEEYSECIDQIFEIIQKYQNSHEIVIGGDFNEDISKNTNGSIHLDHRIATPPYPL